MLAMLRTSFKVAKGYLRGSVATLWYEDKILDDGWGHIKVVTDGSYPDELQAEAAGYFLCALCDC